MHVRKNTNQHLTPLPDTVRADSRFPGRNSTKIHSTLLPQRAARTMRLMRDEVTRAPARLCRAPFVPGGLNTRFF